MAKKEHPIQQDKGPIGTKERKTNRYKRIKGKAMQTNSWQIDTICLVLPRIVFPGPSPRLINRSLLPCLQTTRNAMIDAQAQMGGFTSTLMLGAIVSMMNAWCLWLFSVHFNGRLTWTRIERCSMLDQCFQILLIHSLWLLATGILLGSSGMGGSWWLWEIQIGHGWLMTAADYHNCTGSVMVQGQVSTILDINAVCACCSGE